jgi:peptidoglycan/xylan/chitin deacetylase (PgdA/CDA1 family)
MVAFREAVVHVLGTRPVAGLGRRLSPGRLRVVAYHGVPDRAAFARQLASFGKDFSMVSGRQVADASRGGEPLPPNPMWLTFDDGLRSVIQHALPELLARRLSATIFVCPGLASTASNPWWQVVADALAAGWQPAAPVGGENLVRTLKQLQDPDRRSIVADAASFLSTRPPTARTTADVSDLEAWRDAGLEIGNHTWDHPCLDRCDGDAQRQQIERADAWLDHFGAFRDVRLFAYPNGDWTQDSEDVLRSLSYDAALLFDHRMSRSTLVEPLRISRLRLDSNADVGRARAVASGLHSHFVTSR